MRGTCMGNLILGLSGEGPLENMACVLRGVRWTIRGKEGAGKAFQEKRIAHAKAVRSKGCRPEN